MFRVLERNGTISREPHPEDGRAWLVRLTPKGKRLQKKLWKESADLRDTLWLAIPAKERKIVANNLIRISRALSAARTADPG
jgi:DNA-binding MarR family transcriptional regulator